MKYLFLFNFIFAESPSICIKNNSNIYFVVAKEESLVKALRYQGDKLVDLEEVPFDSQVKCPEFNQLSKNAVEKLRKNHLLKKAIEIIEES